MENNKPSIKDSIINGLVWGMVVISFFSALVIAVWALFGWTGDGERNNLLVLLALPSVVCGVIVILLERKIKNKSLLLFVSLLITVIPLLFIFSS